MFIDSQKSNVDVFVVAEDVFLICIAPYTAPDILVAWSKCKVVTNIQI